MTASELIELLEALDPDTEIRFATQPSWPFEHALGGGLVYSADVPGLVTDTDADYDAAPVAWLAEGEQRRYLPQAVAERAWQ